MKLNYIDFIKYVDCTNICNNYLIKGSKHQVSDT